MYPGADTRDAAPEFQAAFPGASFRKILARAFVASRTLDFVLSPTATSAVPGLHLPPVDASRVSITGHSRNGKQSVIAAAFDERFTSVVGSSPGEQDERCASPVPVHGTDSRCGARAPRET